MNKTKADIEEKLSKFIKAGEIAKEVKKEILALIKPNIKLIDVAEKIESKIKELGGDAAFPVNICINEVAAHYTPIDETDVFPEEGIIKIDFGVHIDGFPVDNALSIAFGDNDLYNDMIETAREAVSLAINNFAVGKELAEIGGIIEDFVKERGFKVIRNLNGHLLDEYDLHGKKEVPVVSESKAAGKIEENEVYAIEVFVTNGEGYAKSSDDIFIYSLIPELPKRFPIRIKAARDILNYVKKTRRTLPFTIRWLKKEFNEAIVKIGMSALEQYGVLIGYPVLIEKGNGIVAQHEETILVKKEKIHILT